jgi:hypothetical protein
MGRAPLMVFARWSPQTTRISLDARASDTMGPFTTHMDDANQIGLEKPMRVEPGQGQPSARISIASKPKASTIRRTCSVITRTSAPTL